MPIHGQDGAIVKPSEDFGTGKFIDVSNGVEPDSGVEPGEGSIYFGSYTYYLDISPNEITKPVKLIIYSPTKAAWRDEPLLTKTFTPSRDKSRIECQLDKTDSDRISSKIRDLTNSGRYEFQNQNIEKALTGDWRYQFEINDHLIFEEEQKGPNVVLAWSKTEGKHTLNYDELIYYYDIFASEGGLSIELRLKYEKDPRFIDYQQINSTTIYKINEWQPMEFTPDDLPNDAFELLKNKASKDELDKIFLNVQLFAIKD